MSLIWFFGFNQWARLWEIVEISTPQVEAFADGITAVGWRQLPFVLAAFFYRRAVILSVKKSVQFVLFILLETHWRRVFNSAISLPAQYTVRGVQSVQTWQQFHDYLLLRRWFLYLYTALILTMVTFGWAEFMLAFIRGSLSLPPILVRYQAQLVTFAGAFVAASIAQWLLLYVWDALYVSLPTWIHNIVQSLKWPVFRHLVQLRYWRRRFTTRIFSWKSLFFLGVFTVYMCIPT